MSDRLEFYKSIYVPLLKDYSRRLLSRLEADAYDLIPQNFIPEWGVDYFKSDLRIAFVGLETYGWGNMSSFLKSAQDGDVSSAYDMSEFQNLDFLNWNNTHRHTFWGFNSFFLGALYGLKNWEVLKWGQHKDILKSIAWGNATSIERWCKCYEHGARNKHAWEIAKQESLAFDDITLLQKVCSPHAILLLCGKQDGTFYLRNCNNSEKSPIWTGDKVEVYKIGSTYIFHAYHPSAMKFNGGAQHFATVIREKMIEFGVFKPLPQSTKDDAATEEYILNMIHESFRCDRPNTFEVVLKIATFLRKQESLMPISMLCRIINNAGCRNNWDGEYLGGRGMYRMLHHFYHRNGLSDEERDAIAMSFVNEYGWHPWDK